MNIGMQFEKGRSSVCVVSASEELMVDLQVHWGAAYRIQMLRPGEVLQAAPEVLVQAIASAVAVLVDWCDHTLAAIPVARQVAEPFRVPIFALCGTAQADHVAALVIGADGTIERPVWPLLLEARLLAYRRLVGSLPPRSGDGCAPVRGEACPPLPELEPEAAVALPRELCRVGPLLLDRTARCVRVRGQELSLTPKEFDLLDYLMTHAGLCRTRDEILDHAWGIGFDTGTNILDVHVYELRKKLRRHGLDRMLQTVRGMGFRVVAVDGSAARVQA